MPEPPQLERAELRELDADFTNPINDDKWVKVQFNPETLKVTFANQIVQPEGGNQSAGNAGRQFVGAGTTKLALQLWFDVNAMEKDPVDDVRRLTQKVVYFMTPQKADADPSKLAPPGVRFQWGSFPFDGMVDGLEETLEFFSLDGKPLRASVNVTISQQKILAAEFEGDGKVPTRPGHDLLHNGRKVRRALGRVHLAYRAPRIRRPGGCGLGGRARCDVVRDIGERLRIVGCLTLNRQRRRGGIHLVRVELDIGTGDNGTRRN